MASMMLWGFFVRFVQSMAQAAPFILTGFFIAAVFRRFIGYEKTRKIFGGDLLVSLFKAWAIGMLLPVCSLGVIPVVIELRRAGIKGGTILAFAMSAPLFNPLSLLYGLTLSEPMAILSFAFCSLVIVSILGMAWDRIFAETPTTSDDEAVHYGIRRIVALAASAGKSATGQSLFLIVCGLAGVGILGATIPHSALQPAFNHDRPLAPAMMAALGIPVYATPMLAMSQMGMMFQHANSIGAAFVLLALGAGMNTGLVVWMLKEFRFKKTAVWMSLLIVIVVGLGYAIEKPLFPADVEPANHTHAFDIYSQPFSDTVQKSRLPTMAIAKLKRDVQPVEWWSLQLLAGLFVVGIVIRLADRNGSLEKWIQSTPPEQTGKLDLVIPGPVLGGLTLIGLVIVSAAGCYAYYPPPSEIFEELRVAKGEALSGSRSGETAHAEYWIDVYQEWTRKLEVGLFLRTGHVSEYQHWKARLVREHLEMLKHAAEDGEKEEARKWVSKIQRSHRRMRAAFEPDNPA